MTVIYTAAPFSCSNTSARKVLTRYLFFTVKDKKPKKPAGAVPQPTDDACPKKKKEKKTTGKKKKVQKRIN
jgi:hypothetical protein